MSGQVINSDPYKFSTDGVNYTEILAVRKILDEIREINAELADELSQKPVSSAYLRQILDHMKPPVPKASFHLPPKEGKTGERIRSLEEIFVINFNKRQTNEIAGSFAIYNGDTPKRLDIGMITLRALEAVFQTPGRTIPEMEAMIYLQTLFLQNIPTIRYKRELLAFLRSIPRDNAIVSGIADKLTDLCQAA